MSNADRLQAAHRLPQALEERLHAIHIGAATWHDYHQAGVLVAELMRSIYLRYGSEFHFDYLELIEHAEWLFTTAFSVLPDNSPLEEYAIECDRRLLESFKHYLTLGRTTPTHLDDLQQVVDELTRMPESPARTHQLAIAHGFMARAVWLHLKVDAESPWTHKLALEHRNHADRLFGENLPESPDGGKAYCSFLLNMALISGSQKLAGWRSFAWHALRLTLRQRDHKQSIRAMVIGQFGHRGEKWLRKRRDTLGVFAETTDRLKVIRRH